MSVPMSTRHDRLAALLGACAVLVVLHGSLARAQAPAPMFPRPNPPPAGPSPNPPPVSAPAPRPMQAPSPQPTAAYASSAAAAVSARPSSVAPVAPAPQPVYAPAPEAPAPAPLPAPPSAAERVSQSYDTSYDRAGDTEADGERKQPKCLIGGFCIGPVITAGALNVFGIGAHARMDYWGLGVDYQFIGLTYDDVDGQLGLLTVEGRVYPFANAFYLAAGLAWQSVALDTTVHVPAMQGLPAMDVRAEGEVSLPLFKLGVGFMGRDGFVLGIDLGFGIRLAGMKVSVTTDLPRIPEVIEAEGEFRAAAKEWIEWLPFTLQLNVIRVGYLF